MCLLAAEKNHTGPDAALKKTVMTGVGQDGVGVVSIVASQHEGPGFNSQVRIFPCLVCMVTLFAQVFLPQSRNTFGSNGGSKLVYSLMDA